MERFFTRETFEVRSSGLIVWEAPRSKKLILPLNGFYFTQFYGIKLNGGSQGWILSPWNTKYIIDEIPRKPFVN